MKPVKAKELIPALSKELELPEDLVQDVVSFYWREVRKSLSALAHTRIHLTNLGDFTIKHWKIEDKILKLEQFERNNELKGMQQLTARFKVAETLYDLKKIKTSVEQEHDRKNFIQIHKTTLKASEFKKEFNTTVEEQGSDS